MSEPVFNARSPGEIMRAAREKQGLHIAALAAAIKVSPRKLDALEHDRWDELPDATFVRALAQTVCRSLKIDAVPVLELLPRAGGLSLDTSDGGLNAPFRERPGRDEPGLSMSGVRPLVVAASVLMLAAVAVYFVPERFWAGQFSPTSSAAGPEAPASSLPASAAAAGDGAPVFAAPPVAPSSAASSPALVQAEVPAAASAPMAGLPAAPAAQQPTPAQSPAAMPVASAVVSPAPTVVATPVAAPMAAAAKPAAAGTAVLAQPVATPPGLVQLNTREASWIEARDANGRLLFSRLVVAGERVGLDGALPMRLTIGNAAGTQLVFRGQPYELAAATRDNVARVELK